MGLSGSSVWAVTFPMPQPHSIVEVYCDDTRAQRTQLDLQIMGTPSHSGNGAYIPILKKNEVLPSFQVWLNPTCSRKPPMTAVTWVTSPFPHLQNACSLGSFT